MRTIHRERGAALIEADERLPSGEGSLSTSYDRFPRTVAWRLRALATAMRAGKASNESVNAAASLLGLVPPRAGVAGVPAEISPAIEDYLSDDQRHAWRTALAGDALVLAPPGVGKTRVLAATAVALSAAGQQVVIAAPSNHATDVLEAAVDDARAGLLDRTLRRNAADHARISAMNLQAAYMRTWPYPRGATLIVDEVSMATLPALIAASRHSRHLVAGGDLFQLGPVVEAPEAVRATSCVPPFGIDARAANLPAHIVRLRRSAPLPEAIASLMRELVYGPDGSVGHSHRDGPLERTRFAGLLTIVDTVGHDSAAATARFYDELRTHLAATPGLAHVIAPTHDRVKAIERYVDPWGVVSTVHGAQGKEAPVAVLDLIGADPHHGWYQAAGAEDEGGRLLTVALTRGSRHTVVAVDVERFRKLSGACWRRFLQLAAQFSPRSLRRVNSTFGVPEV